MVNKIKIFIFTMLLCLSCLQAQAADLYTLDPSHTYVLWQVNHLGFSTQTGKCYASGTLTLDKDNPQNSSVQATIDIAGMVTGNPELDKKLTGYDFFDTVAYPTGAFVSNKVELSNKNEAKVYGKLTLHGVTRPIILLVKLNKIAANPITNQMTAGFSAQATIKRSNFGIKTLLPILPDEVKLDIQAEANQAEEEIHAVG